MITSKVMAFNLALAKTMSEHDPAFREALRENFIEIRKQVKEKSKMSDCHAKLFEILGIEDDSPEPENKTKVVDHRG